MKKTFIFPNCLTCNAKFKTIPAEIRKGGGKYCSQVCYRIRPKTEEYLQKLRNRDLSNRDYTRWLRGDKHWAWKGGVTPILESLRHSTVWKKWRQAVFERDGYICQECGLLGVYLEPHHIIPKSINQDKIFELTNGITLCRPCHIKTMGKESSFVEHYTQLLALAQV